MTLNIQLMNNSEFDYWKRQYLNVLEELEVATNHFDFCEQPYVGVAILELSRIERKVSQCLEMIRACQNT